MNLKPLSAALVGAGIAVVGTAGAIDLPNWLKSDTPVAAAPPQLAPPEKVVPPAPLAAVPGQVPNYRAIVKQSAPAVVGITVEGMHKVSAEDMPGLPARHGRRSVLQVLPRHPRHARHASSSRAAAEPADAVQGHGLGLHHQLRRPDADQRARRARSQGRDRQAQRPARVQRQGAGQRHRHRHRRAAHRRQGPAGGPPRRPEGARGRRPGARDRRALRPRADRDPGHRQRQGPLAAGRRGGAVHPDRRGGQPRQLRRPAVRRQRLGGRHQRADLLAQRRLPGPLVRDPDRRRAEGEGPDRRHRQGPPRRGSA